MSQMNGKNEMQIKNKTVERCRRMYIKIRRKEMLNLQFEMKIVKITMKIPSWNEK